jgi:hypothetical protein
MDDDFLSLVRKQIPMQARKQILKASLRGISELHSRGIVHLGNAGDPQLHAIQLIASRYQT